MKILKHMGIPEAKDFLRYFSNQDSVFLDELA